MVDSDHDMRNPADMLVLDRVARNVLHNQEIATTQDITRPFRITIQHSTIPISKQHPGQTSNQNLPFLQYRMANILKTSDELQVTIDTLQHMYGLLQQVDATTHDLAQNTHEFDGHHRRVA